MGMEDEENSSSFIKNWVVVGIAAKSTTKATSSNLSFDQQCKHCEKWLRSFDQRLRESIDYAICLNSLGSGEDGLWVHVSKPPENAYVKQIFEGLSNVADEMSLKVGLKHKKINVSNFRELADHVTEVNLQHDAIDGMFTFYDSAVSKLQIYQVASVTFDLFLLLALGSYLITLFSFLLITTRGLDDLISLFRRPPPRKIKYRENVEKAREKEKKPKKKGARKKRKKSRMRE